jgi:hypothetical protein
VLSRQAGLIRVAFPAFPPISEQVQDFTNHQAGFGFFRTAREGAKSGMPKGGGGKGGGGRSSNDQRSDAMNPNNPEYQASHDNTSNQANRNNDVYRGSRAGSSKGGEEGEDSYQRLLLAHGRRWEQDQSLVNAGVVCFPTEARFSKCLRRRVVVGRRQGDH